MAKIYGKKRNKHTRILYTIATAVIICAIFLSMVSQLYNMAEDEAYEMLHIQTKQIKDDLTLQLNSDRENLITMANFAAKLYADGESYDLMFDSFKPIGLFSSIRILREDNIFVTKDGETDFIKKVSFKDEVAKGQYISGRSPDLTDEGIEIIRSAVPIVSNGRTVGILYGIINLDTINTKYNNMAKELDAQLFVYGKEDGKFVIDTIDKNPGELSQLKDRKYSDGYSYDDFLNKENGYSSFKSIFTGEDLYLHFSTIEDFNWGIMLARYESQVFAQTNKIFQLLVVTFVAIAGIIALYLLLVFSNERRRTAVTARASSIRKLLIEINQQKGNVYETIKSIQEFSLSRSAFLADTDGEDYYYILPDMKNNLLRNEDRRYFQNELFNYASKLRDMNKSVIGLMSIITDKHLANTNKELYDFLQKHKINKVTFAAITDENGHVTVIGTINPKRNVITRDLLEEVAVCFSIAIYNKKHLNKTENAVTTDSLTGVLNRVAYKKDILEYDENKPTDFACIYIDVNELHIMNNKYGHAAGDEMLIYIANKLKEVFYSHKIYRMGGDEFLVFTSNLTQEQIGNNINEFVEQIKIKNYNVAIGVSYRKQCFDCEEIVREAEIRMYDSKALYYQNKEKIVVSKAEENNYIQAKTGIQEIDTMLSVLKDHYNGIYRVSLDNDNAHRILMPAYLNYNEYEDSFSRIITKYVHELVHPDFHRSVMGFLNYDAIKRMLSEDRIPKITYKKINGETVILSVYRMGDDKDKITDTLWVFAKD